MVMFDIKLKVANILPITPNPSPWPLGSKYQNFTFQNMVMLHIKLKGIAGAAAL